jgi:hypothetical protein
MTYYDEDLHRYRLVMAAKDGTMEQLYLVTAFGEEVVRQRAVAARPTMRVIEVEDQGLARETVRP